MLGDGGAMLVSGTWAIGEAPPSNVPLSGVWGNGVPSDEF